jgi:hypothetical protein
MTDTLPDAAEQEALLEQLLGSVVRTTVTALFTQLKIETPLYLSAGGGLDALAHPDTFGRLLADIALSACCTMQDSPNVTTPAVRSIAVTAARYMVETVSTGTVRSARQHSADLSASEVAGHA